MEKVLVGYDDTPAARSALAWAIEYARRLDGELLVVHVLSSTWEWELAALQINPGPLRHEYERRLREDWTDPVRAAGSPTRRGCSPAAPRKHCSSARVNATRRSWSPG